MIQRVQSLWLLVVAIAAFATYTLSLYVGKLADGALKVFQLADDFLLVSAADMALAFATICLA